MEERAELFDGLGQELGQRLVELDDMVETDWLGFSQAAGLTNPSPEGAAMFRKRLIDLFRPDVVRGIADNRLETHLHRKGGLRHLVQHRPALPTGLPAPFAPFLRADEVRWQITGPLAHPSRLTLLAGWGVLDEIARSAVSEQAAELLDRLGFQRPPSLTAAALMRDELRRNGERADPEIAARLGRILDQEFVNSLPSDERNDLLKQAADARFLMADGNWQEARLVPRNLAETGEEERINAFAPDSAVADVAYTGTALVFYRLALQQGRFQRRYDTFALWAQRMADATQQRALLRYMLESDQGGKLTDTLKRQRPHWLPPTAEDFRVSDLAGEFDDEARGQLMTLLYSAFSRGVGSGHYSEPEQSESESEQEPLEPGAVLEGIYDWWQREHLAQRRDYENRVWPEEFRPSRLRDQSAAEDPVGWFTFFALGMFRTLGWNNETAHRSFVSDALRAGWWEEMATANLPKEPKPWLDRLEVFASTDPVRIDFPQWRRALADLYALARWLPDYAEAFRILPRVVEREGTIKLSGLWRPSYEPAFRSRGLEGAPLTQSLGLGANWMIREAIRHGLWAEEEAQRMHPYAWAATARVRRLFAERLRYPLGERGNMDLSPEIHLFVVDHLRQKDATFMGDFDLPLQLWDGNIFRPEDEEGEDA
jgi:hypothetical protein